eukprot:TRINITY_DN13424_c0_g1_i1.p1 TRINITY_DN13424_c0_g1~~TRINITY_DN13424_c0_g1_i1.p1  ORF type:complete len:541 (-),score=120.92 TRINITY_DN13424_c0_g1_i1:1367-2989(-)
MEEDPLHNHHSAEFKQTANNVYLEIAKLVSVVLVKCPIETVYAVLSGLPRLAATQTRPSFSPTPVTDHMFITTARRYLKFASAAFGWKMIHGLYGRKDSHKNVVSWLKGVHASSRASDSNLQVLCDYTGVKRDWIVAAEWTSLDLLRPAFYVTRDHRTGVIVVCIRGTMAAADALTDIAATSVPFLDGYGHRGIVESSRLLAERLRPLLREQLREHSDIKSVIVTGYSLGGGAATVVALLLSDEFDVQCWAYAAPPVLSPALAARCSAFTVSIVWRDDIVPRLSLANLLLLRDNAIAISKPPQRTASTTKRDPASCAPQQSSVFDKARKFFSSIFTAAPTADIEKAAAATAVASATVSLQQSLPQATTATATAGSADTPATTAADVAAEVEAIAETLAHAAEVDAEAHAQTEADATQTLEAAEALTRTAAQFVIRTDSLGERSRDGMGVLHVAGMCYYLHGELKKCIAMHPIAASELRQITLSRSMLTDHMTLNYERAMDQLVRQHASHINLGHRPINGVGSKLTAIWDEDLIPTSADDS